MLPVSASVNSSFVNGGFFYPSAVNPFYFNTGTSIEYPLNGDFSATFTNDSSSSGIWTFKSDLLDYSASSFVVVQDSYIEILFNVKEPYKIDVDGIDDTGYFGFLYDKTSGASSSWNSSLKSVQFIYDGNRSELSALSSGKFESPTEDFNVYRYFGYRFVFNSLTQSVNFSANEVYFNIRFYDNAVFNTVFWENGDVIESIDVNTGLLQEINGELNEVNTQLTELNGTMSDIKDTVTDTSDQLQDSNSNIWQAAGSTISGAIENLFVPSESDIADVKEGFDNLAKDKLGGAYTAMETLESTIAGVNDKLNSPSASDGIEFPGISVPLGDDLGTVELVEKQMVTLPVQITAILHPVAGTIISIICGLGTFNVLKDMVECFLSGCTYAFYLHRNKGGSDEW